MSNFFAEATLIATVNAQIQEARLIASLVRWGILLFTAAMVLSHLGIAKEIVVAAFSNRIRRHRIGFIDRHRPRRTEHCAGRA
jgi:hypothetical protein